MEIENLAVGDSGGADPARALQPSADLEQTEAPELAECDQVMLKCAEEMFLGGPGWPVLPAGSWSGRNPTNLELKNASLVIERLFAHRKHLFEWKADTYLQQSEARGYLLSVLFGRGLLGNAQTAHDIGVKAQKQIAAATAAEASAGKAARKRQPEQVRDEKAAAARAKVWAEIFDVFSGHRHRRCVTCGNTS